MSQPSFIIAFRERIGSNAWGVDTGPQEQLLQCHALGVACWTTEKSSHSATSKALSQGGGVGVVTRIHSIDSPLEVVVSHEQGVLSAVQCHHADQAVMIKQIVFITEHPATLVAPHEPQGRPLATFHFHCVLGAAGQPCGTPVEQHDHDVRVRVTRVQVALAGLRAVTVTLPPTRAQPYTDHVPDGKRRPCACFRLQARLLVKRRAVTPAEPVKRRVPFSRDAAASSRGEVQLW